MSPATRICTGDPAESEGPHQAVDLGNSRVACKIEVQESPCAIRKKVWKDEHVHVSVQSGVPFRALQLCDYRVWWRWPSMRQSVVLQLHCWMLGVVLLPVNVLEPLDRILHIAAGLHGAGVPGVVLHEVLESPCDLLGPHRQRLLFLATCEADVDDAISEGDVLHDVAGIGYL